jgi:hypothetical protein
LKFYCFCLDLPGPKGDRGFDGHPDANGLPGKFDFLKNIVYFILFK